MGKLRDKMTMEMELRNLSSKTIKSYMWYMTDFTRTYDKSPADMSEEEIREYLHLKSKKKVSWSSINVAYSALKFFYVKVLEREWNIAKLLLEELRKYYKVYRPTLWLFQGSKDNQPISTSIIQRAFKKAKKKPE